jgi:hypothetical protein
MGGAEIVKKEVSKVQFMDGAAVEEVVKVFVACDLQSGNFNVSRLFWMTESAEWMHADVDSVVVSVCVVTKPPRTYFSLGRDGKIFITVSGGSDSVETIPDAGTGKGKLGYVCQIREVAGALYVCGDQGQVYRRVDASWQHHDEGLLHRERRERDISLNSIDGTAANDLYVVGDYGVIFHYDGKKWTDASFQTNLHLQRVKCVSRDLVYVCGERGTLLEGSRHGWKNIGEPDMDATIWDLEVFNEWIYLVAEDRLMVSDGKSIKSVDTKLKPAVDAHRLSSRGGILWSIGENDLAFFDGAKWTRVVHPDNA